MQDARGMLSKPSSCRLLFYILTESEGSELAYEQLIQITTFILIEWTEYSQGCLS